MALAERQNEFHRSVVDVVYRTMDLLAQTTTPNEAFALREELRAAMPWWRGLLRVHEPSASFRCRSCRTWYGRHKPWPCPIWRDALQALHHLNGMYGFLAPLPSQRHGARVTVQRSDSA